MFPFKKNESGDRHDDVDEDGSIERETSVEEGETAVEEEDLDRNDGTFVTETRRVGGPSIAKKVIIGAIAGGIILAGTAFGTGYGINSVVGSMKDVVGSTKNVIIPEPMVSLRLSSLGFVRSRPLISHFQNQ